MHQRFAHTTLNIAAVSESVAEGPNVYEYISRCLYTFSRTGPYLATENVSFDNVCADKPLTLDVVKTSIQQFMAEIPSNICLKVVENYFKLRESSREGGRISRKRITLNAFYLCLFT